MESLTLLTEGNVPDDSPLRAQLNEEELVKLTRVIVAINGANRGNAFDRPVREPDSGAAARCEWR
jgi:alkylhydroperoxidase family enzyme